MHRPPSQTKPECVGSRPFSYARLVKPVLEQKCLVCHRKERAGPQQADYQTWKEWAFYFHGDGNANGLVHRHGGYRTTAGRFGARESRLGQTLLGKMHRQHRESGHFSKDDVYRLTLWLDCNSNQLGAYHSAEAQRQGALVWPTGVDPSNPCGTEKLSHSQYAPE